MKTRQKLALVVLLAHLPPACMALSPFWAEVQNPNMGDTSKLESLIAAGADVDERDGSGATALFYSGQNVAEILIAHGADVNARDGKGNEPLHVHAMLVHADLVSLLIAHGADVNAKNGSGSTPLHMVAGCRSTLPQAQDIAAALIAAHAYLSPTDSNGYTPLFIAASTGNVPVLKLLLRNGAELENKDKLFGQTALQFTAGLVDADIMSHQPDQAVEPLKEAVDLLIAAGADVNTSDNSRNTPLYVAAQEGATEMVNKLVAHGAHLEARCMGGRTPLAAAASLGRLDALNALINAGAAVNSRDDFGNTPLKWAQISNHEDAAAVIEEHGGQ